MVKLLKDLALAGDRVEVSMALGEAAPRFERFKNLVIVVLSVLVILMGVALVSISVQLGRVQDHQNNARVQRGEVIVQQRAILEALGVKSVSRR